MEAFPCVTPIPGHATWRQMHRWLSRHYVYYTMPWLNFKGEREGMAGSWSELVSAQISPRPTLIIWLSDVCSHALTAFENISGITDQESLHVHIYLNLFHEGRAWEAKSHERDCAESIKPYSNRKKRKWDTGLSSLTWPVWWCEYIWRPSTWDCVHCEQRLQTRWSGQMAGTDKSTQWLKWALRVAVNAYSRSYKPATKTHQKVKMSLLCHCYLSCMCVAHVQVFCYSDTAPVNSMPWYPIQEDLTYTVIKFPIIGAASQIKFL